MGAPSFKSIKALFPTVLFSHKIALPGVGKKATAHVFPKNTVPSELWSKVKADQDGHQVAEERQTDAKVHPALSDDDEDVSSEPIREDLKILIGQLKQEKADLQADLDLEKGNVVQLQQDIMDEKACYEELQERFNALKEDHAALVTAHEELTEVHSGCPAPSKKRKIDDEGSAASKSADSFLL